MRNTEFSHTSDILSLLVTMTLFHQIVKKCKKKFLFDYWQLAS